MRTLVLTVTLALSSLFGEITSRHVWKDSIAYEAKIASIDLHNKKGSITGQMYYTSYIREGTDPTTRPITFCFNGGPGSSSIWLHMGALGPRRVLTLEEGASSAPPYHWVENESSPIDITDLVFIDPIGTGFSVAAPDEDPTQFWNVEEDLTSIADFIASYLSEHGRWTSPKYLAGESYGALRAAGLLDSLQMERGIYLNGLILLSPGIDLATPSQAPLSYAMALPSMAATAWYHGRLPGLSVQAAMDLAKNFAYGPYLHALLFGEETKEYITEQLAHWTGLSQETVQAYRGRISIDAFTEEFVKREHKALGVYDTTLVGDALTSEAKMTLGICSFVDPSIYAIDGLYIGTFNAYLQKELGFTSSARYVPISIDVSKSWKWTKANKIGALQRGLTMNPHLKIFVGHGMFDLVTPFTATEYVFHQMKNLSQNRLTTALYEGGHLFYTHKNSLAKLREDLLKFYANPEQALQEIPMPMGSLSQEIDVAEETIVLPLADELFASPFEVIE